MRKRAHQGQVTVEVAILFLFVVAALVLMAIYLQRGVQGGVKSNTDSFGTQFSATQAWNSNSHSVTNENASTVTTNQNTNYQQTLN